MFMVVSHAIRQDDANLDLAGKVTPIRPPLEQGTAREGNVAMQPHPDVLYQVALESRRRAVRQAAQQRHTKLVAPRPWLDPAMWSAILGPIIGLSFLAYFARVILAAVGD
jgi:hypothetical protein